MTHLALHISFSQRDERRNDAGQILAVDEICDNRLQQGVCRYGHFFFASLRAEMALALALASDLLLAPHAFSDNSNRVGFPSLSRSGPSLPLIRAKNDARRGLSPVFTGGLRFLPSALADARPLAFNPPLGFFPSVRCHAGVFGITWASLQSWLMP